MGSCSCWYLPLSWDELIQFYSVMKRMVECDCLHLKTHKNTHQITSSNVDLMLCAMQFYWRTKYKTKKKSDDCCYFVWVWRWNGLNAAAQFSDETIKYIFVFIEGIESNESRKRKENVVKIFLLFIFFFLLWWCRRGLKTY